MDAARNALARLCLVLLSGLAALALAEAGACLWLARQEPAVFARYASFSELRDRAADDERKVKWAWHPYIGPWATPGFERGRNRHNALGYRGAEIDVPKPAGRFRIVCAGGSTTYTTAVDDWRASYPAQLERILRATGRDVDVVNAGVANWSSFETLINFQLRVLDLEPDLVIVYHAVNDVHTRFVWPPEAYRGDNSGFRRADVEPFQVPGILEASTALRILLIRLGRIPSPSDLRSTLGRPADTYWGDRIRFAHVRDRAAGLPAGVTALTMLDANPPVWFRRNLENLVALARSRGIGVTLATFAHCPAFVANPVTAAPEYVRALAEHNDVLRALAAELDLPLFDFAAAFPNEPRLYADGIHVNEFGALRKAQLFAAFLVERGLVPEGS